jgi:putative glutamine amidotransferase
MNIGVTQFEHFRKDRNQMLDCLDQRLTSFLKNFASSVYPIPNSFTENISFEAWMKNAEIEAIILSGGGNVGEGPARDHVERLLINYAIEHDIPLIGICRGMQAIILHFGGSLLAKAGHVRTRHKMLIEGRQIEVNSFHDFCVDNCSIEFNVLARAEDLTIECVAHKEHQVLGIMWHPERDEPFQAHDLNLFRSFIKGEKL